MFFSFVFICFVASLFYRRVSHISMLFVFPYSLFAVESLVLEFLECAQVYMYILSSNYVVYFWCGIVVNCSYLVVGLAKICGFN